MQLGSFLFKIITVAKLMQFGILIIHLKSDFKTYQQKHQLIC